MKIIRSRYVVRDGKKVYLLAVARTQKYLIMVILINLALCLGAFAALAYGLPLLAAGTFSVLYSAGVIMALVLTATLARASGSSYSMAVTGLILCLPLIGLVFLLVINLRATVILRGHGLRVGFLGVSSEQIRSLVEGACKHCEYDLRGLQGPVCPECGTPLRA